MLFRLAGQKASRYFPPRSCWSRRTPFYCSTHQKSSTERRRWRRRATTRGDEMRWVHESDATNLLNVKTTKEPVVQRSWNNKPWFQHRHLWWRYSEGTVYWICLLNRFVEPIQEKMTFRDDVTCIYCYASSGDVTEAPNVVWGRDFYTKDFQFFPSGDRDRESWRCHGRSRPRAEGAKITRYISLMKHKFVWPSCHFLGVCLCCLLV